MRHTFSNSKRAFSMIEILVALLLLAIGLLGLAGMTQIVMRGNDNANHLSNATDVCQLRIEELKDLAFETLGDADSPTSDDGLDFGAKNGDIVQETALNSQGLTDCQFYDQEYEVTGSPCENVNTSGCDGTPDALQASDFNSDPECFDHIREAGPYIYTRSFVVCRGDEYDSGAHPDAGSATSFTTGTYSGEINCQAEDGIVRPESLTCLPEDILNPGDDSNEKMIKILCTWRKRDGRCGFVNFSALRVNL